MSLFADVRAVLFDLDDTLCGYWDASKAGLRQAFSEHAPEGVDVETMVRYWATAFRDFSPRVKKEGWYERYCDSGEPTRTEQMRRTLGLAGVVDEARAQRLSESYMRNRDANLRLFPDAIEVLEALQPRYPMGLITNGPADIQRQEIATCGVEKYFDPILIEGEMREGKPAQAVFRRAERALNLSPAQILFVGNSYHHDIVPAVAADWRTVWVRRPSDVPPSAGPYEGVPEEKPADGPEPDATIGELRELLPLLGLR